MTPSEVQALIQLRRWHLDRSRLRSGKAAWRDEHSSHASHKAGGRDATLTRVLSFEKAFEILPPESQALLIALDLERHTQGEAAALVGCCVRKVGYLQHIAREQLAESLERHGLM